MAIITSSSYDEFAKTTYGKSWIWNTPRSKWPVWKIRAIVALDRDMSMPRKRIIRANLKPLVKGRFSLTGFNSNTLCLFEFEADAAVFIMLYGNE